jgi:hypothetical protein
MTAIAFQNPVGGERVSFARPSPAPAFQIPAKEMQARIGAAIRRRRRAIEITLTDLAHVCGVSFQQVQKYESGACSISAAQLWTMAQALGVPITYFYEAAAAAAAPVTIPASFSADAA